MLFNSYLFLLAFLPAVTLAVLLLQYLERRQALFAFVILSSAVFYGYSSLPHLVIFYASIFMNYQISRFCRSSYLWLSLGVAANIGLLGVFKYAGFVTGVLRGVGLDVPSISLALPLAMSLSTFQQISFLIDSRRGIITRPDLLTWRCPFLC